MKAMKQQEIHQIQTIQNRKKMESNLNKFISVAYKLYTVDNDNSEMVEEATAEAPFQFISGYGTTLDAFEHEIASLATGDSFDFTLTKEQAYGDYEDAHVLDLDKEIFSINGHFDHNNIFVDAIVPLQNEDGNRFYGRVLAITNDKVKVDLNHPLAGKTLNFKGKVVESREATNEEIQGLINRLSGEGCCCGCGHDHGDDCGCGNDCGCGDDCGCGHCH